MIGKTNAGTVRGIINVVCPNVSTVTMTQSGHAYSFTQTGTNLTFKLPNAGEWTIAATYNGITVTKPVTIVPGVVQTVTIGDSIVLYDHGVYATGFENGWTFDGPGRTGIEHDDHIQVDVFTSWKTGTSKGSIDLTGYRTLKATITGTLSGGTDPTEQIWFNVINGSGTVVAGKTERKGSEGVTRFDTTWVIDVSTINYTARFQLRAQTWSGGSNPRQAEINLYKIELLA